MKKLTIGQLAKQVGVRPSTLRYYEEQGLITPGERTEAGYRLYDPDAVQILQFIQRAQHLGFSLADIHLLLETWRRGEFEEKAVYQVTEKRYLALEKQITQILILQHELGLFLQDIKRLPSANLPEAPSVLDKFFNRICCSNPIHRPAEDTFNWLLERNNCTLTSQEVQNLLDKLRGQHVHIWQEQDGYSILIASNDPEIGQAIQTIANLESHCQVHAHTDQNPEFLHNDEGYLILAHGENAFILARIFLSL